MRERERESEKEEGLLKDLKQKLLGECVCVRERERERECVCERESVLR